MKYRLWSEEEGKWLEPGCGTHCHHFYAVTPEGEVLYLVGALSNEEVTCEKVEAVIQRWTGLHDTDGKEIYEGDILDVTCLTNKNSPVLNYTKVVKIKYKLGNVWSDDVVFPEREITERRVIGNIFENPDLK